MVRHGVTVISNLNRLPSIHNRFQVFVIDYFQKNLDVIDYISKHLFMNITNILNANRDTNQRKNYSTNAFQNLCCSNQKTHNYFE